MSDRVWLVRHASTAWSGARWCGRTDLPLSPAGVLEAEGLAARPAARLREGVEVWSSPLARARATAQPTAARVGAPMRPEPQLREVDFGAAEGMTWPELEAAHPDLAVRILAPEGSIDWPDGDSAAEVSTRAMRVLDAVASAQAPIVLVTHGRFLGELLRAAGLGFPRAALRPASAILLARAGATWRIDEPVVSR